MAEWMEVMRQWRRMCDKHTCSRNKDAFTGLPICPIVATHEGYPCDEDPIDWTEKATKQLEEIVMQWAAEHPEPVYETWFEYLLRIGVIPENAPAGGEYQWIVESIKHKHISNDIAESLKLHPKEAQA